MDATFGAAGGTLPHAGPRAQAAKAMPEAIMRGPGHAASQQMNDPNGLTGLQLQAYRQRWPEEADTVDAFLRLLGETDAFVRERLAGHFTASAWLVDRTGTRALLTHHRKLERWLQPGGHADGETDLRAVALKEAEEESGLAGLRVGDDLFDLDRHWIPEHRGVPGHWHHDARYVVRAGADEDFVVGDESHDLAWRDVGAIAEDAAMDPSLRRMARKWLARRPPHL
jgi:8-oxo-dGTP pyrophosphatase MutT (NUDIX family)